VYRTDKKFNLEDRLVEFAANAVLFSKDLPSDMTRQYYGNQFLRSGGSSALNFSEAQGTNTNRDYINKAGISPKELEESKVNLKIFNNIEYGKATKRGNLLDEVE
jgi:four helix bundle protein